MAFFLVATAAVALQSPKDGSCFVYPSPATGDSAWVVYEMPESGASEIDVYNEAGDLVTREPGATVAGTFQTSLDLTHYRRGIYICRVVLHLDSGSTQVLKLSKFIVAR